MTRPLAALTLAVFALAGCSGPKTPSAVPSLASDPTSAASAPSAPATASASKTAPKGEPSPAKPPPGPIEYFRIKTKPSCPSSGPATSFPGNPIVLEWKVTDASNVTISIDGPGVYDTYPATHQQEFSFPCSGNSGTTQKHTYLLKVVGSTAQASLTGEARVN